MKRVTLLTVLFLSLLNVFAGKMEDGLYAELSTSKGKILLQLEFEKTPMTVANFAGLAQGQIENKIKDKGVPYYDGLNFHRVIKDFMIQGGCPLGNGQGDPGYKFSDEIHPELKHAGPGILSMANAGPGTNGSQFFITHKETPWLDGKHTVFGHVVEGQDVVDAIQQNDKLEKVTILAEGSKAKEFAKNAGAIFKEEQKNLDKKAKERQNMAKANFEKEVKSKYPDVIKTESGLMYVITEKGSGTQAEAGKKVTVHYTGKLMDGTKFDSSKDRDQPFSFALGKGQVIQGWDEGISLLKEGDKGVLFIPSELGYGSRGAGGVIPPHSNLMFEVELLKVQ